jgi:hypothetical protein
VREKKGGEMEEMSRFWVFILRATNPGHPNQIDDSWCHKAGWA